LLPHGSTSTGTDDANGDRRCQASPNPLETLEFEEKTAL
jgi:hypothetical protein